MNQPQHGLRTTYTNWKCRCEACTAANTVYVRERREARRMLLTKLPPVAEVMRADNGDVVCGRCYAQFAHDLTECPECGQEVKPS